MSTSSDLPEVNLKKSLDHISNLMGWFVEKIRNDVDMGLFDINRLSEDILIPILSEVYGCTHLENLNKDGKENFPGIDLGDAVAKVAFQITSEADSAKIADTLQKFVKYEHYKIFDHMIVYIITEKQGSYAGTNWSAIIGGRFKFEKNKDIRDRSDLLKVIRHFPLEKVQRVESILEEYLEKREKALTADQLRSIANQSLDQHRERFAFNEIDKLNREILRDIHPIIVDALAHSSKPVIGVSGPSGIGKSTLLRQIGRDINDNNRGFALWIPAESVNSVVSVDELILTILRKQNADLGNRANSQALELASQTDIGLVLLVDDINRILNPSDALAALNALSANASSKDVPICFVVPLWPGQTATAPDEREAQKNWTIVSLGYFSEGESKNYSELVSPAEISKIEQLINSLGGDPFLIGLATEDSLLSSGETIELLHRIFDYTIKKAIAEAITKSNERATPNEFGTAIDSLIDLILSKGTPEPFWKNVRTLGQQKSNLLFDLAKINQLGWIDRLPNGDEVWRWKHTRLRDLLVGRWLAKNILQAIDKSNISDVAKALLDDPGLAEAFALAFVFLPEDARQQALTIVSQYQPLALVETLRLNLFPYHGQLNNIVIQGLRKVIADVDQKQEVFVGSPGHIVLYNLAHITNPSVLDITDGLANGWFSRIARLRNGDLQAGMPAVLREADSSEILMLNYPFLDQAVADFGQVRSDQKQETVRELSKELLDPNHTIAVLYVGSILKWPELIEPFWDNWINLEQETRLQSLATMVWFLSGYEDSSIIPKLEAALLMSLAISDIPKSQHMGSERQNNFVAMLRLALARRTVSDTAVKVWVKIIPENEELCKSMAYLLGGIDHPDALDAYLHYGRTGYGMWTAESIDPMVQNEPNVYNPAKSEETRNHLWKLLLEENDLSIRRTALSFWAKAARPADLPKLQSILEEDALFENILKVRLRLRDKTAASLLIEKIQKDPHEWCRFAPLVADEPGVFDAILNSLEAIRAQHGFYLYVNSIFYRLPAEQIKQIVLAKEDLLLASPEAWSALWFSGEDTALKFVVKAIRDAKGDTKIESRLEHFFSLARSTGNPGISQKMLSILLPVLDCFPEENLKWLADLALRNGFGQWAVENLGDVLKSAEWQHFKWVYAENVIATLSEAAQYVDDGLDSVHKKSRLFSLEHSYRDRDQYGYVASPVDAVKIWLKDSPASANLIISARIMTEFGTSDDIDWWLAQKPSDEKALAIWSNALYHLRRRCWQSI